MQPNSPPKCRQRLGNWLCTQRLRRPPAHPRARVDPRVLKAREQTADGAATDSDGQCPRGPFLLFF
eukprot:4562587-Alexandrium_andersonii.AAC.1